MSVPVISFFSGRAASLIWDLKKVVLTFVGQMSSTKLLAEIYALGITSWRKSKKKDAPAAKISSTKSIEELTACSVLAEAFKGKVPELFGVIGGPPCTDFSVGGLHASHEGDAGKLTGVYISMLLGLRPGFFLLENVPHLETNIKHRTKFLFSRK